MGYALDMHAPASVYPLPEMLQHPCLILVKDSGSFNVLPMILSPALLTYGTRYVSIDISPIMIHGSVEAPGHNEGYSFRECSQLLFLHACNEAIQCDLFDKALRYCVLPCDRVSKYGC
jgi:hypothetical protein